MLWPKGKLSVETGQTQTHFELEDLWWSVFCVHNRLHKYSLILVCATYSTLIGCSMSRRCISCTPFRPLLWEAVAPYATTGRRAVQPPNFWVIIETRRRSLGRSSHNWPPGSRSNVDHPRPCADARAATSVQQPCSNPSKSPEN